MTSILLNGRNEPLLNWAPIGFFLPRPLDMAIEPELVIQETSSGNLTFTTRTGDMWFPTHEHWFQACKSLYQPLTTQWDWSEAFDHIATAPTPEAAKFRASKNQFEILPDIWDASAFAYMFQGHLAKFSQNKEARDLLVATGDVPLVENRRDEIWGVGKHGTGLNRCGKSLEMVRRIVRNYWT